MTYAEQACRFPALPPSNNPVRRVLFGKQVYDAGQSLRPKKFNVIDCPEGTRLVRRSELPSDGQAVSHDQLVVPQQHIHPG